MDVGTISPIKTAQLSVWTGLGADELKPGHLFKVGAGHFRVDEISGDTSKITRVAFRTVQGDNLNFTDTPTSFADADRFDVRDVFETPVSVTEGPAGGFPPFNTPKTGPMLHGPGDPADVNKKGQGMQDKVEIMGPERKERHPWILRSPQQGTEPAADDRRFTADESYNKVLQAIVLVGGIDPQQILQGSYDTVIKLQELAKLSQHIIDSVHSLAPSVASSGGDH